MRSADRRSERPVNCIFTEDRIPKGHPMRRILALANEAPGALSPVFDRVYASEGRPSLSPEMLLRAYLQQIFCGIRSERFLMEQIDFDLVFRWLAGRSLDERVWRRSVFSRNRNRLLEEDAAVQFPDTLFGLDKVQRLLLDGRFAIDGSLIHSHASMKSVRPKGEADVSPPDRNVGRDFRGEWRSNETHESTADAESRLYRKGVGTAKPCFTDHVLTEGRHVLAVDAMLTRATGTAGREAALEMMSRRPGRKRKALAADRGCDAGPSSTSREAWASFRMSPETDAVCRAAGSG